METMNFLLDRPLALLIVLLIGGVIGIAIERTVSAAERARKRAYWQGRNQRPGKRGAGGVPDRAAYAPEVNPRSNREALTQKNAADFAADQLKLVSKASFTPRPLLNGGEAKVFAALDKAVIALNPGWQVMAQVSLGEFLASPD